MCTYMYNYHDQIIDSLGLSNVKIKIVYVRTYIYNKTMTDKPFL